MLPTGGRRTPAPELASGLLLGLLADRLLADPRRLHPVAGLGMAAGALERRWYRDSVVAGVAHTAASVGIATAATALIRPGWIPIAAATWSVVGGTSLARVGLAIADTLDRDDVDAARALIPSLCGRDPDSLDADGICRAAVESIAENTSDATIGPLWWGAVLGLPGLVGYRTVNTLDAMVGYRNDRYRRFGWAAARLDDLANVVPARLTALLAVTLGERSQASLAAWRRDAPAHPSPNAGVVEASFAGALGLRLGGRTVYRHGVEDRPPMGDGGSPGPADLRAAVALSRRVQVAGGVVAALLAIALRRGGPQLP
ncbi:cobalamin biosynthesis protein [Gordonia soli]|uniref:Cobalamin biosynthesis protein CobD n=1 Tax=Gordonia soli NBRC 108243 TaxID=1223545 RepID=M0QME9_9ACTN|nr:cobalamin biosynthesis protein [Gordonia soli]GAC69456.1 adenosylcobinamide-phosphate synthase [Gordonia soli NBRC 108243]